MKQWCVKEFFIVQTEALWCPCDYGQVFSDTTSMNLYSMVHWLSLYLKLIYLPSLPSLFSLSPIPLLSHSFPLYFPKDFSCPASNLHGLWSFARGRLWCGFHPSGWPDSLWYQLLPPCTTSRHWHQTVYSEAEREHDRNARYHGYH